MIGQRCGAMQAVAALFVVPVAVAQLSSCADVRESLGFVLLSTLSVSLPSIALTFYDCECCTASDREPFLPPLTRTAVGKCECDASLARARGTQTNSQPCSEALSALESRSYCCDTESASAHRHGAPSR